MGANPRGSRSSAGLGEGEEKQDGRGRFLGQETWGPRRCEEFQGSCGRLQTQVVLGSTPDAGARATWAGGLGAQGQPWDAEWWDVGALREEPSGKQAVSPQVGRPSKATSRVCRSFTSLWVSDHSASVSVFCCGIRGGEPPVQPVARVPGTSPSARHWGDGLPCLKPLQDPDHPLSGPSGSPSSL